MRRRAHAGLRPSIVRPSTDHFRLLDRPLPADDERHDQARLDPLAEHLPAETKMPEHPVPESEHVAPLEPGRLVHAQVNSPAGSGGIQPYHGGRIRQDGRMCRSAARKVRERSKEKKESGHFQMDSGRRSLQTYDFISGITNRTGRRAGTRRGSATATGTSAGMADDLVASRRIGHEPVHAGVVGR